MISLKIKIKRFSLIFNCKDMLTKHTPPPPPIKPKTGSSPPPRVDIAHVENHCSKTYLNTASGRTQEKPSRFARGLYRVKYGNWPETK